MLAFVCNELLLNRAVNQQIDNSIENLAALKRDKWLIESRLRRYRSTHSRKQRMAEINKQALPIGAISTPNGTAVASADGAVGDDEAAQRQDGGTPPPPTLTEESPPKKKVKSFIQFVEL